MKKWAQTAAQIQRISGVCGVVEERAISFGFGQTTRQQPRQQQGCGREAATSRERR